MLLTSKIRRGVPVGGLALWLSSWPVPLRGQTPAGDFSSEFEVREAQVDVVVRGADGYPVLGLNREDFDLLVDGQPVTLTHFAAFEDDTALRIEGSNPPRRTGLQAEERMLVAVLFDPTFVAPGDLKATVEPLREFLTTLRPRDRAMLVSADPRLEIVSGLEEGPPTAILAALEDLVDQPTRGRTFLADYRDLLDQLGPVRTYGSQSQLRAKSKLAQVEAFAAEGQQRMERVAANLHQLISHLAGLPGRRVVIYVSGRLPIGLGQRLLAAWEQGYGESSPFARLPETEGGPDADSESMLFKAAPRVPDRSSDRRLFTDIGRHANLAQVVLMPVDAATLRSSPGLTSRRGAQGLGTSSAFDATSSQTLAELASATGGQVLGGEQTSWDPRSLELANYYRIGFSLPQGAGGSEYRLDVRLRPPRSGIDVHHPRSVSFPSFDQEAIHRVRAAVVLGAEHNVLGIQLTVLEMERGDIGTKARLKVRIPLPNLALIPSGQHHLGRLSVFVLAASWDGATSEPIKAVLPIRLTREQLLTSLAGPVELTVEILVPEGLEAVGVGVRDHFASVFATTVAELPTDLGVAEAGSQ